MSEKLYRGYIHLKEAWYAHTALTSKNDYIDEVQIGVYDVDGGTIGEMAFRWYHLMDNKYHHPSVKLECFHDAFDVLWQFQDVIEKLRELDSRYPSPEEIMALLDECGFKDATPRKDPYNFAEHTTS